jgi:hypothetical protein
VQILLNELSLTAQYTSIDHFIDQGIKGIFPVFNELQKDDTIFKKHEFYACKVTQTDSIHDIFKGSVSRTSDELRKFKVYLSHFFEDPYWEDDPKQDPKGNYLLNNDSISGSSIAESIHRDCLIISFSHENFKVHDLIVNKDGQDNLIGNLFDEGQYTTLLYTRGLLSRFSTKNLTAFSRTQYIRQGERVYLEIQTGNFWYLDALHKNHFEVFDSNGNHVGISDLQGNIDTKKKVKGRIL